ncbi:MAG TPA: hypothetical protein VNM92_13880 [Thermoanaerobaculia bacterium]|nr:hypothetical protein [Thermoanaerobaculia bacterium]
MATTQKLHYTVVDCTVASLRSSEPGAILSTTEGYLLLDRRTQRTVYGRSLKTGESLKVNRHRVHGVVTFYRYEGTPAENCGVRQ